MELAELSSYGVVAILLIGAILVVRFWIRTKGGKRVEQDPGAELLDLIIGLGGKSSRFHLVQAIDEIRKKLEEDSCVQGNILANDMRALIQAQMRRNQAEESLHAADEIVAFIQRIVAESKRKLAVTQEQEGRLVKLSLDFGLRSKSKKEEEVAPTATDPAPAQP